MKWIFCKNAAIGQIFHQFKSVPVGNGEISDAALPGSCDFFLPVCQLCFRNKGRDDKSFAPLRNFAFTGDRRVGFLIKCFHFLDVFREKVPVFQARGKEFPAVAAQ